MGERSLARIRRINMCLVDGAESLEIFTGVHQHTGDFTVVHVQYLAALIGFLSQEI